METIELSFTMQVTEESKNLCNFLNQYGFRTDYKRHILVDFKLGYFVATIGTHLQAYRANIRCLHGSSDRCVLISTDQFARLSGTCRVEVTQTTVTVVSGDGNRFSLDLRNIYYPDWSKDVPTISPANYLLVDPKGVISALKRVKVDTVRFYSGEDGLCHLSYTDRKGNVQILDLEVKNKLPFRFSILLSANSILAVASRWNGGIYLQGPAKPVLLMDNSADISVVRPVRPESNFEDFVFDRSGMFSFIDYKAGFLTGKKPKAGFLTGKKPEPKRVNLSFFQRVVNWLKRA